VQKRYEQLFTCVIVFSLFLVVLGLILDGPEQVLKGMVRICTNQTVLITDYVEWAGIGAALVNSGLVTLISILLLHMTGDPCNGFTFVEMGLMAGFSLFGKDIVNIWPIILGSWLYAKYQKEPFAKYVTVGLLATSVAPLVSYMMFGSRFASIPLGWLVGIVIGFILPPLSDYTYKIQNGMNLYNMGFACGLIALMAVPILTFIGDKPMTVLVWATDYNAMFTIFLVFFCGLLILLGFFVVGDTPERVWKNYKRLLQTTGRAPSDYLRMFDYATVMVNMGVNGLIGMSYILLIGGQLNGPTVGGIFTIMGFSAFGKHALNIIPVMAGVALGGYVSHHALTYPSLQLAALFGTTLAPISGHFGAPYGVLAGFIHSALVLTTSDPVAGINLYNNGFSGGLVAVVLYPALTSIARHRRPVLQDEDYFELFEDDTPITKDHWRLRRNVRKRSRKRGHMSDVVPEENENFVSSYPQMPRDEVDPRPEFDSSYPQMPRDE